MEYSSHLSISDTQALKGVALLMLLAHHCLMNGQPYDDIIVGSHYLVAYTAEFCKLCVAMFVFLSGYGLTVSTERRGGLSRLTVFYRRRFTRLMVPYWVIWALFVPFGVFVMGRTMESIYHTHIAAKAVADFCGLFLAVTGSPFGYNATWWFYSCIIPLYLAFPLLYRCRREPLLLLAAALTFDVLSPGVPLLYGVSGYATAFTVGIMSATRRFTPPQF